MFLFGTFASDSGYALSAGSRWRRAMCCLIFSSVFYASVLIVAGCRHDPGKASELQSRPNTSGPSSEQERGVVVRFNQLKMKKLHEQVLSASDKADWNTSFSAYQSQMARSGQAMVGAWYEEELEDLELGSIKLGNFLSVLESWISRSLAVSRDDLGLNFVKTSNNKITTLSDKEDVWPRLMEDLGAAKDSIHIVIFGLMGDAWGQEVFALLQKKVKQGVKVRVLADALGARDHWYFKHANKPFLDAMRATGIEIIVTATPNVREGLHFDHRKFYVIDGKIAYNTGYTIEEHMRRIHFDMAFRVEGDMVKQMQAHFFASYLHFGGRIEAESREFSAFMARYFPQVPAAGKTPGRLLPNIPWVQHRATETYYQRILDAKHKVSVINEFMSEPKFLAILEKKAKQGIKLEIIYPRLSEWSVHRYDAYNFFEGIKKLPNVKIFLYDGPQNTGWLHTKGIIVDNAYLSFGSTNMDSLSLYHNYEMNIESEDAALVLEVQTKIIDYAIRYAKPYEMPASFLDKIRTWTAPAVSIPLKYFFKAL